MSNAARHAPATGDLDQQEPAISVRELTKVYGERAALRDATFAIPRGTIAGLVGPNGAGKSTTMRMLLGLVRPTGGSVDMLGAPLSFPFPQLRRVGAMIEEPAFDPRLDARRNLEVLATLGGCDRSRVTHVLDQVGLGRRANDLVAQYSTGMRQRLGLAAALLPAPDLVILDEPANGLDPAGRRRMAELLDDLRSRGVTILVSSHILGELEKLCDRVVVLHAGQLMYEGTVGGLIEHVVTLRVDAPDTDERTAARRVAQDHGCAVEESADALLLRAPSGTAEDLVDLLEREGLSRHRTTDVTTDLEDAFLHLTGASRPAERSGGEVG